MSVNKEMFDRLKEKYPVKIETDSDKECYAMHDVKIRLAGCDTIIPIRYYPETNANLIGATLMSRFSFSIINTKELSTLYIRAN